MDETTPPPADRSTLPSRRVAWALGFSILVHVIVAGLVVRVPVARAASMPTPHPFTIETSAPLAITTPKPTPVPAPPTPPSQRHVPPPAARPQAARPVARPRRVAANVRPPRAVAPQQDPITRPASGTAPQRGDARAPGTSGDGDTAAATPVADAAPATVVAVSPKPSCPAPDVDAHATDVADPEIPDDARAHGETGTARIRVTLDVRGLVTSTQIDASTGFGDLDRAAMNAANASRFAPEIRDCVAVGGTYLFVATFDQ